MRLGCSVQLFWAYGASLLRGTVFVHSLRKSTEVPNHIRVPKAKVSEVTAVFAW